MTEQPKRTEERRGNEAVQPKTVSSRKQPVEKIKGFRKDLGDGLPHPLEVIRLLNAQNQPKPKMKQPSKDIEPELDAAQSCVKVTARGARRKLYPGYPCDKCKGFFTAIDLDSKDVRLLCKHKQPEPKRAPTPPGFYDPGWHSPTK